MRARVGFARLVSFVVPGYHVKQSLPDVDSLVLRNMRGEVTFEDALRAVVAYQRDWNPQLAAWWARRGFVGDPVSADEIPAVPTDVFRSVALHTVERASSQTFRTSGTTSGARGEHRVASTLAYEHGAALQWQRWVQPEAGAMPWHALTFSAADVPDSSLAFMVARLGERFASAAPRYYVSPDRIHATEARDALRAETGPVLVIGTAFALVALIDEIEQGAPLGLPAGSRVVETGGFKGRTRTIERTAFYALLGQRLGIPRSSLISEYSMTELSSQLYSDSFVGGDSATGLLQAPPWVRVSAVDPLSLVPVPAGTPGLLRIVDLANTSSVVAVQTADIGVVHAGGIELRGRVEGAVPRGCGLAVEELENRVRTGGQS